MNRMRSSGRPDSAARVKTWAAGKPGSSQGAARLFSGQSRHGIQLGGFQFPALWFEAGEGGLEVGRGEAASPVKVAKATCVCSKFAAEVTALMPPASAEAPPASAAPSPTFSPTTLRLAIFFPDSATNWIAPAIARRSEVMAAPRVTIRVLMRRGRSQPGRNVEVLLHLPWGAGSTAG
jgi:hypothetical protein